MNETPAYIIKSYLVGEGLLTDPADSGDWPVYTGVLPDSPEVVDDIVACMDTSGVKDGRSMKTGVTLFHQGVQILLRSEDYNDGYAKVQTLADALAEIQNAEEVISGTTYEINNVTQTTDVIVLSQEEGSKRRGFFSVNFLVTITVL